MNLLVFDSGLGGLSVTREITKLLPNANIAYLADHAYFPYGKLSEEEIINRVLTLMGKILKTPYDAVVIACNTASTIALKALRETYPIPFIGTVPAIKPAALMSKTGLISILATPGTVKRDYTKRLIHEFAADKDVILVGAKNLADYCERLLCGEKINDQTILDEILPAFIDKNGVKTDCIVLACTHYPIILDTLKRLAPWQVTYIDPAPAIASRVKSLIIDNNHGTGLKHAFTTGKSSISLEKIFSIEGFSLGTL